MHKNCFCFQCRQGSRENALNITRLDVAQNTTVNVGVPLSGNGKSCFIYSIGLLENFDHPEIIITGLRLDLAHVFLNVFREWIKEGNRIEAEKIYTEFSEGEMPTIFKIVGKSFYGEFLGYGLDYYKTIEPELFKKFSALQMVWCDTQKRFPWDEGYEFSVETQPLLFLSAYSNDKPLIARITNSDHSTRLKIFNPNNNSNVLCRRCSHDEFTFIQTDYVVCLECGKQQPYNLEWTDGGVIAAEKL